MVPTLLLGEVVYFRVGAGNIPAEPEHLMGAGRKATLPRGCGHEGRTQDPKEGMPNDQSKDNSGNRIVIVLDYNPQDKINRVSLRRCKIKNVP